MAEHEHGVSPTIGYAARYIASDIGFS